MILLGMLGVLKIFWVGLKKKLCFINISSSLNLLVMYALIMNIVGFLICRACA